MTGIWTNRGEGWELGSPQAFPQEATLHSLIEKNPQLLPLAGSPRLAVLGSEIQLGTGYADILCGRVVRATHYHRSEARQKPGGT